MNFKLKGLLMVIFSAVLGFYFPILEPLLPSITGSFVQPSSSNSQ